MEVDEDEPPKPLSPADPLPDFRTQLAQHGAGQAIKLAFACVEGLVVSSFSSSKYPLAIELLGAVRSTAAQVRRQQRWRTTRR